MRQKEKVSISVKKDIVKKNPLSVPRARIVFGLWIVCVLMAFGDFSIPSFSQWYMRLVFFLMSTYLYGGMNNFQESMKRKSILISDILYIFAAATMLFFIPNYQLGLDEEYFLDSVVILLTIIIYFIVRIIKNYSKNKSLKNKNNEIK